MNSVLQYYVCFRNKGLTRVARHQIQDKKSAIKSRKRNPQSNPGKEIRNQIQEKKSAIKSRRRNPQSNPGKEIRNQIQEKKSAMSNPRSKSSLLFQVNFLKSVPLLSSLPSLVLSKMSDVLEMETFRQAGFPNNFLICF